METEKIAGSVRLGFVFGIIFLLTASAMMATYCHVASQRDDTFLEAAYFGLAALLFAAVSGFYFAYAALALKALPNNYREVIAQEKAVAAKQELEKMVDSNK